jgi:hypothetical protein
MNDKSIEQLFVDTKIAFENSPIKKYADQNGKQWYYSISSTRLNENSNVIIGFNWGAAGNDKYKPQVLVPHENFKDLYDKKWLGSLERIYQPLKLRFPNEDIDQSVQTNFCFFRSKVEGEITDKDLELSTPLFHQLISIIKPKRIIGFSKRLQSYFIENGRCSNLHEASFASNRRTLHTAKGFLKLNGLEVPIYFLPHPNAKFTNVARRNAWDFCFDNK